MGAVRPVQTLVAPSAQYRQRPRLEEHDDLRHPVVALATKRIEELSARPIAIDETIRMLDPRLPDAIPDLRPTLRAAAPDELADLFDAFDVTAVYDKPNQTLELRATVTPELVPQDKTPDRVTPGRGNLP